MKLYSKSDITFFQALSISGWDIRKIDDLLFKKLMTERTEQIDRESLELFYNDKNKHFPNVHRTNGRRVFSPITSMSRQQRSLLEDAQGNDLLEIDCSNSQPFLLVHEILRRRMDVEQELISIVAKGEFYEIFDHIQIRDEVKVSVFQFMYNKKINIKHPVYTKLVERFPMFTESMLILSNGKSMAAMLQRMESDIWISNISATLMMLDIKHATVHDSVLFSEIDEADVLGVVKNAFGKVIPMLHMKNTRTNENVSIENWDDVQEKTKQKVSEYAHHFWELRQNSHKDFFKRSYDIKKIIDFLNTKGYNLYFTTETEYIIVQVKDNKINEISDSTINKTLVNAVKDIGVCSNYIDDNIPGLLSYITDKSLSLLPIIDESKIYTGEKDLIHLFYSDYIIQVGLNESKRISYKGFDFYIWDKHVMKRKAPNKTNIKGEFEAFFDNVIYPDNREYAQAVMGYALHSYRDLSNMKAVVFNDDNLDDSSRGGTGKGIMRQALTQFLPTVVEDGKAFKAGGAFSFQNLNMSTRMLVIDDAKKGFPFEQMFSVITDGLYIEKKHKQPFFIPPEKAPLIVITANYGLPGSDDSHIRRRLDIMLKKHYTAEKTPNEEFGHLLFADWEVKQWESFDTFMIDCCKKYMKMKPLKYDVDNKVMITKQFNADTHELFKEFMDLQDWSYPQVKNELINNWVQYAKTKEPTKIRFTKMVKKYCSIFGFDYSDNRKKDTYSLEKRESVP